MKEIIVAAGAITPESAMLGFIGVLLIIICIQLYRLPEQIGYAVPTACGNSYERACEIKGMVELDQYSLTELRRIAKEEIRK
jgi:hypothetical protein